MSFDGALMVNAVCGHSTKMAVLWQQFRRVSIIRALLAETSCLIHQKLPQLLLHSFLEVLRVGVLFLIGSSSSFGDDTTADIPYDDTIDQL